MTVQVKIINAEDVDCCDLHKESALKLPHDIGKAVCGINKEQFEIAEMLDSYRRFTESIAMALEISGCHDRVIQIVEDAYNDYGAHSLVKEHREYLKKQEASAKYSAAKLKVEWVCNE